MRNNLVEAINSFNPYSIQKAFKTRDNTLIGGSLHSAHTETVRAL